MFVYGISLQHTGMTLVVHYSTQHDLCHLYIYIHVRLKYLERIWLTECIMGLHAVKKSEIIQL